MGKGGNNKCSRSQMSMDAGAAAGVISTPALRARRRDEEAATATITEAAPETSISGIRLFEPDAPVSAVGDHPQAWLELPLQPVFSGRSVTRNMEIQHAHQGLREDAKLDAYDFSALDHEQLLEEIKAGAALDPAPAEGTSERERRAALIREAYRRRVFLTWDEKEGYDRDLHGHYPSILRAVEASTKQLEELSRKDPSELTEAQRALLGRYAVLPQRPRAGKTMQDAIAMEARLAQYVPQEDRAQWMEEAYRRIALGYSPTPLDDSWRGNGQLSWDLVNTDIAQARGYDAEALAYHTLRAQGQINQALGLNEFGARPGAKSLASYLATNPEDAAEVTSLIRSHMSDTDYQDEIHKPLLNQRLRADKPITELFTPAVIGNMAAASQEGLTVKELARTVASAARSGQDPVTAIRNQALEARVPKVLARAKGKNRDQLEVGLYPKDDEYGFGGGAKAVRSFDLSAGPGLQARQAEATAYQQQLTDRVIVQQDKLETRLDTTRALVESLGEDVRSHVRKRDLLISQWEANATNVSASAFARMLNADAAESRALGAS